MKKTQGLIAATHTPMQPNGRINIQVIPDYFNFLMRNKIGGIFLNGSTSEGYHLTKTERMSLAEAWNAAAEGSDFKIFLFTGHLSTKDACELSDHATSLNNVYGIAVTGPFYQRPSSIDILVDVCAAVASAAPDKWFYYYHIPVLTQINFPMAEFLPAASKKIPRLAGVKFTHNDLEDFILSMNLENMRFDLLSGIDELSLASYAIGAKGFIGSTYNFLAPLYFRMFEAFDKGDHEESRFLQNKAISIIREIIPFGYVSACKFIMQELGVNNGIVRLPSKQISETEKPELMKRLKKTGFFTYACS